MPYDRLSPGTVLDGRFQIVKLIKAGGMGAVYEVADRHLNGKSFALKEFQPSADPNELQDAKDRFISEIQVMQGLLHPGIPRISTAFLHEDSFYFVMELVQGTDLSRLKKTTGNPGLPPNDVVNWAVQVLDALNYLHSQSPPIVHRDIKPSNLLLRESDGRVLLIDFGIARATNPAEGYWIGTPGYAPPEQQAGKPQPSSDLYALGATIHELLSGVKPTDFDFATFEHLGVEIPNPLQQVVEHALQHWPEDRLATAQEMSERLCSLPNFTISSLGANREHDFEAAVASLKESDLDPALEELIAHYGNECHTPYLPPTLSFLTFTLGTMTNFELLISKNADQESIDFHEKQGLLEPVLLGSVHPLKGEEWSQVRALVRKFAENYERFKNSSWQIM